MTAPTILPPNVRAFNAQAFAALVRSQGMTLAAFSREIGINRITIRCWLRGKYSPTLDQYVRLCRVLEVELEHLVTPSAVPAKRRRS